MKYSGFTAVVLRYPRRKSEIMLNIDLIRELCQKGDVYWSRHLFKRIATRGIKETDIVLALENGEIII